MKYFSLGMLFVFFRVILKVLIIPCVREKVRGASGRLEPKLQASELPGCGSWGSNLGPVQEQCVFLTINYGVISPTLLCYFYTVLYSITKLFLMRMKDIKTDYFA